MPASSVISPTAVPNERHVASPSVRTISAARPDAGFSSLDDPHTPSAALPREGFTANRCFPSALRQQPSWSAPALAWLDPSGKQPTPPGRGAGRRPDEGQNRPLVACMRSETAIDQEPSTRTRSSSRSSGPALYGNLPFAPQRPRRVQRVNLHAGSEMAQQRGWWRRRPHRRCHPVLHMPDSARVWF